jgi:general secretion pathway protein J
MTAQPEPNREAIAGFTLLEALIATALLGTILAALATITAQWLPNWNRGMSQIQRNEHIALGLERITADLAAAEFIPVGRQTRQPLFDGADRSVTFVRTALNPNAGPGLEIVRIAEVSSASGPVLVRSQAPFVPASSTTVPRVQLTFRDPVVLLRAPYRVGFSYAGPDRIWRDAWRQQMQLPKAVKLTLRDVSSPRIFTVSTATPIHVALPMDCIVAKSLAACLALHPEPPAPADNARPRS